MPKHNPQILKRKAHVSETRAFDDLDHPDSPVTITWVRITPAVMMDATARSEEFLKSYSANGLPLANGEVVRVTETIARTVCIFEALQPAGLPEEDRYSAEDFVAVMHNQESAWYPLQAWSQQFIPDLSDLGNSTRTTG